MDESMRLLLQTIGINMFVGNAEKRGRRYGLSNNQVTQTLDGLSNYLFSLNQSGSSMNLDEALAKIIAALQGQKKMADPNDITDVAKTDAKVEKEEVTLNDIYAIVVSNQERISLIEGKGK